jgi:hypothetical protein
VLDDLGVLPDESSWNFVLDLEAKVGVEEVCLDAAPHLIAPVSRRPAVPAA